MKVIFGGTGICSLAHLTRQVEGGIKSADLVLYLVNEPVLEKYIVENAIKSISLEDLYFSSDERKEVYNLISDRIALLASEHNRVLVLSYGHPIFISTITTLAISKLDKKDIETEILPAVSAFDCLISDLKIDPIHGCMIVDASVLISKNKEIDVTNHTILTQIAVVLNVRSIDKIKDNNQLNSLKNYLLKYYPAKHRFIIYEASLYPHQAPTILNTTIEELEIEMLSTISTGYIPPV